jgi:hypothetical protein
MVSHLMKKIFYMKKTTKADLLPSEHVNKSKRTAFFINMTAKSCQLYKGDIKHIKKGKKKRMEVEFAL